MALQFTIPTAYGYDVTYWRIITLHHDILRNKIYAEIAGYKDKSTREYNNAIPLITFGFQIQKIGFIWKCDLGNVSYEIHNFEMPESVSREWIYNFIKTACPDWSGATDV